MNAGTTTLTYWSGSANNTEFPIELQHVDITQGLDESDRVQIALQQLHEHLRSETSHLLVHAGRSIATSLAERTNQTTQLRRELSVLRTIAKDLHLDTVTDDELDRTAVEVWQPIVDVCVTLLIEALFSTAHADYSATQWASQATEGMRENRFARSTGLSTEASFATLAEVAAEVLRTRPELPIRYKSFWGTVRYREGSVQFRGCQPVALVLSNPFRDGKSVEPVGPGSTVEVIPLGNAATMTSSTHGSLLFGDRNTPIGTIRMMRPHSYVVDLSMRTKPFRRETPFGTLFTFVLPSEAGSQPPKMKSRFDRLGTEPRTDFAIKSEPIDAKPVDTEIGIESIDREGVAGRDLGGALAY